MCAASAPGRLRGSVPGHRSDAGASLTTRRAPWPIRSRRGLPARGPRLARMSTSHLSLGPPAA
eukprot:11261436-Alexandrium_andersonii.AAC.1